MGVRLHLVLDREIPGGNPEPGGRSLCLAVALGNLDDIAAAIGVTPLFEFLLTGDSRGRPDPGHHWFPSRQGLETIRALLDHLRPDPSVLECMDPDFPDFEEGVLAELEGFGEVLEAAGDQDARFHLLIR